MTTIAKIAGNNPLFINGLVQHEAEFLDRTSLIACVQVCTFWCKNMQKNLDFYLEKNWLADLPEKLIKALHKRKLSFLSLPVLDPQWLTYDEIGDPVINADVLPSSLMRMQFTDGRVGILASVRIKKTPSIHCIIGSYQQHKFHRTWKRIVPDLNHPFFELIMRPDFKEATLSSLYDYESGWAISEIVSGTHLYSEINGPIDQVIHTSLPRREPLCDYVHKHSLLLNKQHAQERSGFEKETELCDNFFHDGDFLFL